jgi:hypothetical protein
MLVGLRRSLAGSGAHARDATRPSMAQAAKVYPPRLDVVEGGAPCGQCRRSNVLGLNVPLFQNAS